jgi:hypothetical protein
MGDCTNSLEHDGRKALGMLTWYSELDFRGHGDVRRTQYFKRQHCPLTCIAEAASHLRFPHPM